MPENCSSAELTRSFCQYSSVVRGGLCPEYLSGTDSLYYQAGNWVGMGPRLWEGAGWTDAKDAVTVSPCFTWQWVQGWVHYSFGKFLLGICSCWLGDEVEATWAGVCCFPKQVGAISEECSSWAKPPLYDSLLRSKIQVPRQRLGDLLFRY